MKRNILAATLLANCLSTASVFGANITIGDAVDAEDYGFAQAVQNSLHPLPAEGVLFQDNRGGSASLLLARTNTNNGRQDPGNGQVNGIAWRKNDLSPGNPVTIKTLDDLVALGTIEFDYYADLDDTGQELTVKFWCTNTLVSAIYLGHTITTYDSWQTARWAITEDTVFRGKSNGSVTNPTTNNKPLSEIRDAGWCSGAAGIIEMGIVIGAKNTPVNTDPLNTYIDHLVLGDNTFDFELTIVTQYAPDAPDGLTATSGDTELLITFDMPEANGSDITHFEYEYSTGGGSPTSPTSTGGDEPSFTITGLTNGTDYTVRVRSVNGIGTSDWSDPVTGAPEAGVSPPDAPSGLSANVVTGDVLISFIAGNDNGAQVTDYEAYVDGVGWISTGATESPATVTGLPAGSAYDLALRGVNSEGNGSISESIEVVIPADTDGDGVPDANDPCPNDPTCTSLPVPALPWPALLILIGLVSWCGRRRLMA